MYVIERFISGMRVVIKTECMSAFRVRTWRLQDVLTSPFTAPRTSGLSRMDSQSPSPVSSESRMAAEKSAAEQSVAEQSAVEQSAVEQSAAEQEAAIDEERRDVSAMNAGIMAMTTTQILDLAPESTSNAAANLIEEFVEICDVDGNCVVIKCDEEGCEPCYGEMALLEVAELSETLPRCQQCCKSS